MLTFKQKVIREVKFLVGVVLLLSIPSLALYFSVVIYNGLNTRWTEEWEFEQTGTGDLPDPRGFIKVDERKPKPPEGLVKDSPEDKKYQEELEAWEAEMRGLGWEKRQVPENPNNVKISKVVTAVALASLLILAICIPAYVLRVIWFTFRELFVPNFRMKDHPVKALDNK